MLYTLVNDALRGPLIDGCRKLQVPAIPVLDPVIGALGAFLGRQSRGLPGQQHILDSEYFGRIDAMTFAVNHDDGQSLWGLNDADVILVGVSRTSKTPTCIYLANRGIKAANVPIVPGVPLPAELFAGDAAAHRRASPTIPSGSSRCAQNRLNMLHQQDSRTEYTDRRRGARGGAARAPRSSPSITGR